MIHDQADELRQLVRQRAAAGEPRGAAMPLVVVGAGKGDVGATTTALNLAIALARRGRRAVLVDADLDHGGHANLGQFPQRGTIVDVLAGRRSVHEVLERGPSGIQFVPGAWPAGELGECSASAEQRLIDELKHLSPHADVAVIDSGAGRGPFVRRLWRSADAVLMVTTSDAAAIMESYAAIKVLLAPASDMPIYTLVNRAAGAEVACDVHARLNDACRRFLGLGITPAGHVPECEAEGEPVRIYPARSTSARALDRAADTLWARLQARPTRPATDNFAPSVLLAPQPVSAGVHLNQSFAKQMAKCTQERVETK